jgi:hypothetical protein
MLDHRHREGLNLIFTAGMLARTPRHYRGRQMEGRGLDGQVVNLGKLNPAGVKIILWPRVPIRGGEV